MFFAIILAAIVVVLIRPSDSDDHIGLPDTVPDPPPVEGKVCSTLAQVLSQQGPAKLVAQAKNLDEVKEGLTVWASGDDGSRWLLDTLYERSDIHLIAGAKNHYRPNTGWIGDGETCRGCREEPLLGVQGTYEQVNAELLSTLEQFIQLQQPSRHPQPETTPPPARPEENTQSQTSHHEKPDGRHP